MLSDLDALEQAIETYQELREKCYRAARADDGKLMGNDSWLQWALSETDLNLTYTTSGIDCSGSTFTTQTMSNEHFSFTIPFDAL